MTLQQTVTLPADRRPRLDLSLPEQFPAEGTRLEIVLLPPVPRDEAKVKFRAARQKPRELCKDSKLTVDGFLAMKHADRVLEAAVDERLGSK
jgi:type IV secretory pathway ATPase VirB11/archaellum biosynthesis ATPase